MNGIVNAYTNIEKELLTLETQLADHRVLQVVHLRDAVIKEALEKLGWLSPQKNAALKKDLAEMKAQADAHSKTSRQAPYIFGPRLRGYAAEKYSTPEKRRAAMIETADRLDAIERVLATYL